MVKTNLPPMIRRISLLILALGSFTFVNLATAQTVRWNPPDELSQGKVGQIGLVFDNCIPDSGFKPPKVDGLDDFSTVGQSSETRVEMNGLKITKVETLILSYLITPQRKGRIDIPAFDVPTNKGKIRVPALTLSVDEGGPATTAQGGDQLISTTLETSANTVWQGQIFPLRYEMLLMVDEMANITSNPNKWKPSGLVVDEWPQPQQIRRNIGGYNHRGFLYQTQAYASKAGNLESQPIDMEAEIVTGRSMGFFGQATSERISLKSNPLKLTVKELPKPSPASFTGAVGQFRLESKLTQTEVTAGQPVTWTLTLKGTGNWPDDFKLPERHVPANLRVIQPDAKKENVSDKLFEATLTEDVVLIPDQAGKIELAPVQFSYFNPEKGTYETLTTEPATLNVTPDLTVSNPANTLKAPTTPFQDNINPSRPKTNPDLSKPVLPRDPINGTASAHAPINNLVIVGASTLLVLSLLPFWLLLARRHSVETHRFTHERKALDQALLTVKEIETAADESARKNLLLRWQHLVSTGFAVEHATPSLKQLESSSSRHLDEEWIQLWKEADTALYSADSNLPSDWASRAREASAKLRLPRVPLLKTLSPKHLFPAVMALLLLSLSSVQAATDDGMALYQKGDFSAAEKAWQQESQKNPGDWITHNNLGLALAQEKEWGPAVAQWASAFLHSPSHPDVEWNLALGLSKLDNNIPELDYLQKSEALPALARLLSPFQWQVLSLAAVFAAVIAAAFMLFQRYRPALQPGLFRVRGPQALLVCGLLAFVVSLVAIHTYGVLGDARAGMIVSKTQLRSVPTDADSKQATRDVNTGMIVLAEKSFLGWSRVRLANNETGWVRQEHLQRLY